MYSKEIQRKGARKKANLGNGRWILEKKKEKKAQKRARKRMSRI